MQLLGNERASLCEGKGPSAKPEAQAASDVIGGPDAIAADWVLVHAEPRKSGGVRRQSTLGDRFGCSSGCAASKVAQVLHATLFRYSRDTGQILEPVMSRCGSSCPR